eukprot:Gb_24530 [translate_table: standard]
MEMSLEALNMTQKRQRRDGTEEDLNLAKRSCKDWLRSSVLSEFLWQASSEDEGCSIDPIREKLILDVMKNLKEEIQWSSGSCELEDVCSSSNGYDESDPHKTKLEDGTCVSDSSSYSPVCSNSCVADDIGYCCSSNLSVAEDELGVPPSPHLYSQLTFHELEEDDVSTFHIDLGDDMFQNLSVDPDVAELLRQ